MSDFPKAKILLFCEENISWPGPGYFVKSFKIGRGERPCDYHTERPREVRTNNKLFLDAGMAIRETDQNTHYISTYS